MEPDGGDEKAPAASAAAPAAALPPAADAAAAAGAPAAGVGAAIAGPADAVLAAARSAPGEPIVVGEWLLPIVDTVEIDQSKQTALHASSIAFAALVALPPLLHQSVWGGAGDDLWAMALVTVVAVAIGYAWYRYRAHRLLGHHLGEAALYAPARTYLCRDRPNPLVYRQSVARATHVTAVDLVLQCWERYETRGAQGETLVRVRELYNRRFPLITAPAALAAGDTLLASVAVPIAPNARLTADGPLPQVHWTLRVYTRADGLPVYTRDTRIEVRATP